jgi:hypothetical protein
MSGAFDIIEHVADDEAVLRGLRRRPPPAAARSSPCRSTLRCGVGADEIGNHQRRYRLGELEAKLGRNRFEIVFSSSFRAILLPLMAANRFKARLTPGAADTDIQRGTALGPRVNSVLTAILRAEVRLTLAGLRWPLGGSCVVVARAV